MDIASIVRQIDAEIDKLERARAILSNINALVPLPWKTNRSPQVEDQTTEEESSADALPRLTVVPAKMKREYRRSQRFAREPRALCSEVPDRPVFVPRPAETEHREHVVTMPEMSDDALEAALRHNLLVRR